MAALALALDVIIVSTPLFFKKKKNFLYTTDSIVDTTQ